MFEDALWLVGPRRRYRVSEGQKVKIAARLAFVTQKLKAIALGLAFCIPLFYVAGSVILARYFDLDQGGFRRNAMIVVGVAVLLQIVSFHLYRRRMIEPLIVGLETVDDRIGLHEKVRSFATNASRKLLIILSIIVGGSTVISIFVLIAIGSVVWLSMTVPIFMTLACGVNLLTAAFLAYVLILRAGRA